MRAPYRPRRSARRARASCAQLAAPKRPHPALLKHSRRHGDLRKLISTKSRAPLRCPRTPFISDRFRIARFEASLREHRPAFAFAEHAHSVFHTPPRSVDPDQQPNRPLNEWGSNLR